MKSTEEAMARGALCQGDEVAIKELEEELKEHEDDLSFATQNVDYWMQRVSIEATNIQLSHEAIAVARRGK